MQDSGLISAIRSQSLEGRLTMDAAIHRGLSVTDVEELEKLGLFPLKSVIANNILPRKTWDAARKKKDQTLTAINSERIVRVARISARAQETFGSEEKASRWLERPSSALNNKAPMALLATDAGARAIELLLDRIAFGFAA